jgi:PTS system cellobiose-specific IIB component
MTTLRVVLTCNAGMSTDFLVQRLNKKIKESNLDMTIKAIPLGATHIDDMLDECDVLLVAPQVRYQMEKIKGPAESRGIPIATIPFQVYGLADADKILELISEARSSLERD